MCDNYIIQWSVKFLLQVWIWEGNGQNLYKKIHINLMLQVCNQKIIKIELMQKFAIENIIERLERIEKKIDSYEFTE